MSEVCPNYHRYKENPPSSCSFVCMGKLMPITRKVWFLLFSFSWSYWKCSHCGLEVD